MTTETTDKALLTELRAITKDKANWQTAIADYENTTLRYFAPECDDSL